MRRFSDLEAFIAVVESGSFTAAAERLDVAKSAVSRRVTALEERLGVQLLRRTTRRLNLTETGKSFYEHSARILADLDYHGAKLARRFDANTYLRISDMWSRYDAAREGDAADYAELFARSRQAGHRYLVFSIDSDFCFYPEEQAELAYLLKEAGVPQRRITVHSEKGHDAFLLEPELFAPHLKQALAG